MLLRRGKTILCLAAILCAIVTHVVTVSTDGSCTDDLQERVTACLDQVESDESRLPGGPCSSSDWRCICTKQQGMADCYSNCPSLIPYDDADFDKKNCAGQHDDFTMQDLGGTLMYSWSDLSVPLQGDVQVSQNSSVSSSSANPQSNGTTVVRSDDATSSTRSSSSSNRNGASVRHRFEAVSLLISCMLGNLAICMLS